MSKDHSVGRKVALMQPTFLPWLGYFGLINDSDLFVFLDDFQFVRRSYHHRNRLFLKGDEFGFITLPILHSGEQETAIKDAVPAHEAAWVRKVLSSLKHNYGFSPWFQRYYDFMSLWLNESFHNLADMNIYFIQFAMREIGLATSLARSSEYDVDGKRSARLVSLLTATQADEYLSARGSFDYMKDDGAETYSAYKVAFQDFVPPPYKQKQSASHVPYLSILDALFQVGPEATRELVLRSAGRYSTWQEMDSSMELSDVKAI